MNEALPAIEVRPYQLMAIVCRIGEGKTEDMGDDRLTEILRLVREDPSRPVTMRCNVESTFKFQNPGTEEDTPEGALFNVKRDLDIVQKLGLVPGTTRPARELFMRLLEKVPTAEGVCYYTAVTSDTWRGGAREDWAGYEKGCELGIEAITRSRTDEERAESKRVSVADMYKAERLRIRPHHLMCMSCFFGGRDELAPIAADNLFEAIDIIQKNPEVPVELICGPCMVCTCCKKYHPDLNLCISGNSMALRDEKKDLDVLQRLGLQYGDRMPARDLYRLLYERIPSTTPICGYGDNEVRAYEWRICSEGPDGNKGYLKARAMGLGIPGLEEERRAGNG